MNMMAPEQQLLDSRGIAMEIDDDGRIGREQRVKNLVIQPMRMGTLGTQYEQVGDIHNAHTQLWQFRAQNVGCRHDFERRAITNTYQYDIGTDPIIDAGPSPDRSARPGMINGV